MRARGRAILVCGPHLKSICALLFCCVLGLVNQAQPPAGPWVPVFSEDFEKSELTDWTVIGDQYQVGVVSDQERKSKVLRFRNNKRWLSALIQKRFAGHTGTLKFQAAVKCSAIEGEQEYHCGKFMASVFVQGEARAFLGHQLLREDHGWKLIDFSIPDLDASDEVLLQIGLFQTRKGTMWVDDIRVFALSSP